jgi:hypothetical protein
MTITGGQANYGGGIVCAGASVSIYDCIIEGNYANVQGGGMLLDGGSDLTCAGCLIKSNTSVGHGGGAANYYSTALYSNCTFYDNSAGTGGGLYNYGSTTAIDNCIIASSAGGGAVASTPSSPPALSCCNLYANVGGDWSGYIAGQADINNNMSVDPLFCDAPASGFRLESDSPCLTGICGMIGAFGRGCFGVHPVVQEIADIGNDQGRQVRLTWERSVYDAPNDSIDISGYEVYRRQDEYLASEWDGGRGESEEYAGMTMLGQAGWDYIATVPAHGESLYQYVSPTLCDSTDEGVCWSIFFIRGASDDPFDYYDSVPDSGYSIDNLAPAPPPGLVMTAANRLEWEQVPDEDFDYYTAYGSNAAGLDSTAALIGYTTDTMMDITGHSYDYYHVTATDFAGNEGEASSLETDYAHIVPDELPTAYALAPSEPNPFRIRTLVAFDLPRPGPVRLAIYDARGRLVRTLTDKVWSAGRHSLDWRGYDEAGRRVGPGTYFIRIKAGDFKDSRKVVLTH